MAQSRAEEGGSRKTSRQAARSNRGASKPRVLARAVYDLACLVEELAAPAGPSPARVRLRDLRMSISRLCLHEDAFKASEIDIAHELVDEEVIDGP